MAGSLDSAYLKLIRAVEHYQVFKHDFGGGFDECFYPVRVERHREGLEYRFYACEIEPVSQNGALVLGDAYHNLRCALDHLVYELHVRRYRGKVPWWVEKHSLFPINERFPTNSNGKRLKDPTKIRPIQNLGLRERTAIDFLQPYRTRELQPHGGLAKTRIQRLRLALSDIGRFENTDKHRTVRLITAFPSGIPRLNIHERFGFRQDPAFGIPLVNDARVDTWTFILPPPPEYVKLHAGIYAAVGVELSPTERLMASANLWGCISVVALIVSRFQDRFPPSRVRTHLMKDLRQMQIDVQPRRRPAIIGDIVDVS